MKVERPSKVALVTVKWCSRKG